VLSTSAYSFQSKALLEFKLYTILDAYTVIERKADVAL